MTYLKSFLLAGKHTIYDFAYSLIHESRSAHQALLPQETVNLYGKYIYQITIQDMSGETEIPSQGILGITNNIDKAIIK